MWQMASAGGLTHFTETLTTGTDSASVWEPSIGTDVGIVLQTRGTGYIAADAPDGTATGGNARGDNAVDLQVSRLDATYVASGNFAAISGGASNTASSEGATVGGGIFNNASGQRSTIGGGDSNEATAERATVGGGRGNNADGQYATIPGGRSLHAPSYGEVALGYFNTDPATVNSTTFKDPNDRLLVVGNGQTGPGNELDALRLMKSGNMAIGNFNPTARLHVDGDFRVQTGTNIVISLPRALLQPQLTSQIINSSRAWPLTRSSVISRQRRLASRISQKPLTPPTPPVSGSPASAPTWASSCKRAARATLPPTHRMARTAGGNARGDYAVDLQMLRTSSAHVASGDFSTISGGVSNDATGNQGATVGGGIANTERSTIGGGDSNEATAERATVGGGRGNNADGQYATIPGG